MTPYSPTGGASEANAFDTAVSAYYHPRQWRNIQTTRVGIAGAGGLGSNIAAALVRSGFRHLELVDFDCLEAKNLNRQYYFLDEVGQPKVEALAKRLRAINPAVELATRQERITEENIGDFFKDAEYVFEAFDRPEAKRLFLEHFITGKQFIVMGSGMAGISNATPIVIRKLKEHAYIVGDGVTNVGPANPPCAPRVSVCAGLMASVVLEHVCAK